MTDCIFCKIIRGESEASVVYENDLVLALMDLVPVNPGHTLVIPRQHHAQLHSLPPEIGAEMFKTALRVERAIRASEIACEGTNLLLSNGRVAGQEVFHLHLHVIPRLVGDGSGFRLRSVNRAQPGRENLNQMAARISAGI